MSWREIQEKLWESGGKKCRPCFLYITLLCWECQYLTIVTNSWSGLLVEQDDGGDIVLISHSPDVVDCIRQRPLCHDVRVGLSITLQLTSQHLVRDTVPRFTEKQFDSIRFESIVRYNGHHALYRVYCYRLAYVRLSHFINKLLLLL